MLFERYVGTVTSAEDRAWGLSSSLKGCFQVTKLVEPLRVKIKEVKGVPRP